MNQCCFRWRQGAYSVKKDGKPSSFYGPDIARFCPQCGEEFKEKKEQKETDVPF